MEQIELKVYIKGRHFPFTFVLSSKRQLENIYQELEEKKFIHFGPIVISVNEIRYMESREQ